MAAHRRLAQVNHHILTPGQPPPGPSPTGASTTSSVTAKPMKRLTQRQLKDWIADGVMVLPIDDFSDDFHLEMFDRCEELQSHNERLLEPLQSIEDPQERMDAVRNLTRKQVVRELPEITDIVRSPTLSGALHSILGPGYSMHPHRALHTAGSGDQQFHKDGHHLPMRAHRPRFVMAMYCTTISLLFPYLSKIGVNLWRVGDDLGVILVRNWQTQRLSLRIWGLRLSSPGPNIGRLIGEGSHRTRSALTLR
jgi:hypothetical protein